MASIRVIEEEDPTRSKRRDSKAGKHDKSHKSDKKHQSKDLNNLPSADLLEENDPDLSIDIQRWSDVGSDSASELGSMMSLTMDEAERDRLLIEEEESSATTVEDQPTIKGTSYYIQHQRFIESSVLTPLEEVCDPRTSPLSPFVIENLKNMGMQTLFPVQAEVIPFILRGVVWGGDVCVCAPTGSGKTLAYVIPIVQALQKRVVKRLRALVLVPTHDLVVQVSSVFLRMVEGTDLVVEALYGNKGFAGEQARLVSRSGATLTGGSSAVDIVVSTPGRLVDHLQETPDFTLQHLQFLVLDEADRLLMHSFQDWLPKVLESVHSAREGHLERLPNDVGFGTEDDMLRSKLSAQVDAVTNRAPFLNVAVMERQYTHLQKLLFSATLTQNPEKIDSLRLVNPQYFTATTAGKSFLYTIPTTLEQKLTVCTEQHKPLLLLHILQQFKDSQTLCFVGSIETAHRLTLLLKFLHAEQFLNGHPIHEYSSSLSQQERNQIILKFKAGTPGVIICSDVMARGLDISNVRAVINYDLPFHVKTYVHRVGRTGRAGRAGTSWSIAMKEEVRKFKSSLSKAENSTQNYIPLPYDDIKQHFGRYKEALRQLHIETEREKGAAAVAQSLQHASFSLPLDSTNPGDLKSIFNSLQTQVATAWFPEDVHTILAPPPRAPAAVTVTTTAEEPSHTTNERSADSHHRSTAAQSQLQSPKRTKPSTAPVSSPAPSPAPTQKAKAAAPSKAPAAAPATKAKRKRRNKKNELDSLSFSSDSSDSSSDSDSSDSEEKKPKKSPSKASKGSSKKSSKSADSAAESDSVSKKNRKKRKRGQLDSLSLSSTSSSSSDSEEKPKKKEKRSSKDKKDKKKRKASEK